MTVKGSVKGEMGKCIERDRGENCYWNDGVKWKEKEKIIQKREGEREFSEKEGGRERGNELISEKMGEMEGERVD